MAHRLEDHLDTARAGRGMMYLKVEQRNVLKQRDSGKDRGQNCRACAKIGRQSDSLINFVSADLSFLKPEDTLKFIAGIASENLEDVRSNALLTQELEVGAVVFGEHVIYPICGPAA